MSKKQEASGHTLEQLMERHDAAVKRSEALLIEHHSEADPTRAKELLEQSDRYLDEGDRWMRAYKARSEVEANEADTAGDAEAFETPQRVPRGRDVGEGVFRVRAGGVLTDPSAIAHRDELYAEEVRTAGKASFTREERVLMKSNTPSELVFYKALRDAQLTPEEQKILEARQGPSGAPDVTFDKNGIAQRVATTGVVADGGAFVPTRVASRMAVQMVRYGPFLRPGYAMEFMTPDVAPLTVPVDHDDGKTAPRSTQALPVAENAALTPEDPNLASVALNVSNFATMVHVTDQLLRASQFNIDSWLTDVFARRFGRGINSNFTTLFTAAAASGGPPAARRSTVATAHTLVYADIAGMVEEVDDVYHDSCRWQMAQSTRLELRELVDSDGRPLWAPYSIAAGAQETLLGYPIDINPGFGALATDNAIIAVFGSFADGMGIRKAGGYMMARSEHVGFANFRVALRMNTYCGAARLINGCFEILAAGA